MLFSRWELVNGTNQISLFRSNPDGTGLELYYGANSHATGANIAGSNDNVIQFLERDSGPMESFLPSRGRSWVLSSAATSCRSMPTG